MFMRNFKDSLAGLYAVSEPPLAVQDSIITKAPLLTKLTKKTQKKLFIIAFCIYLLVVIAISS